MNQLIIFSQDGLNDIAFTGSMRIQKIHNNLNLEKGYALLIDEKEVYFNNELSATIDMRDQIRRWYKETLLHSESPYFTVDLSLSEPYLE